MMARQVFLPGPQAMRRMVEDLARIAQVPTDRIEQLSRRLQQQPGFLSDDGLRLLLSEFLVEEPQRAAAFNALHNLSPDNLDDVLATIDSWRRANEQNGQELPDNRYAELDAKLRILIGAYPALDRMAKARRLTSITGNELGEVSFICDARPIYTPQRDGIEGIIAITTMRVLYERQNELSEEIEFVCTEEQLDHLIANAQKAKQKLSVLRRRVGEWIPDGFVDAED